MLQADSKLHWAGPQAEHAVLDQQDTYVLSGEKPELLFTRVCVCFGCHDLSPRTVSIS
jgi:hypothetical protein